MAESNLARNLIASADEPLQDERHARGKPTLALVTRRPSLWSWKPMQLRIARRRMHIQIDECSFKPFRVF